MLGNIHFYILYFIKIMRKYNIIIDKLYFLSLSHVFLKLITLFRFGRDANSWRRWSTRDFLFIINKMKVIYTNERQYNMPKTLLIICVKINIDDTLCHPLKALKVWPLMGFSYLAQSWIPSRLKTAEHTE